MRFIFCVTLIASLLWECLADMFVCGEFYGAPKPRDCKGAVLSMPEAGASKLTPLLGLLRQFVEPQQLVPPFSEVKNVWKTEMEQIPKYWRYSKPSHRSLKFPAFAVKSD